MIRSNRLSSVHAPLCVPPGFIFSIAVISAATFCIASLIPALWSMRLLACTAIAFAAWRTLAIRFHRGNQYGFTHVVCDAKQQWWLQRSEGERIAATLCDNSFVSLRLVVLNLRVESAHRNVSLLIWNQQCGYQTFRRLRIRLLLQQCADTTSSNWPPAG